MENYNLSETAMHVLKERYFIKDEDGTPLEDWKGLSRRVARHLASAESREEQLTWEAEFYRLIFNRKFIPNTPTLVNAGRNNGQGLMACYVLPVEDSMSKIMDTCKDMVMIHKGGGGTGFSFSKLRGSGDFVKTTTGVASGPISFMTMYDAATEAVKQGGVRRGANMGILRCDHPNILSFIDCKQDLDKMNNFNISVAVTDKFMNACIAGEEYDLIDPRTGDVIGWLNASEVFEKMYKNSWLTGEPGIYFIDTANKNEPYSMLAGKYMDATNPCGEVPLPAHEACTLGSFNLSLYVTDEGNFDYDSLEYDIKVAVRMLDNVVEVNEYPIPQIKKNHRMTRKIGIGIMGWANALTQMGIIYGANKSIEMATEVYGFIREKSEEYSDFLGELKGVPEGCKLIGYSRRNHWTTIVAPTGTISIIADCSSGVEPLYNVGYIRTCMDNTKMEMLDHIFKSMVEDEGIELTKKLKDKIFSQLTIQDLEEIPNKVRRLFRTAADVTPEQHIRMQAAFQENTHGAVSKTINMPGTATEEDVKNAFILAWKLKCKGTTVYRDGSRENQVLSTTKKDPQVRTDRKKFNRTPKLNGSTEKFETEMGSLLLTINVNSNGEPIECIVYIGRSGHDVTAFCEGIGRMISMMLQHGISATKIAKKLKGIRGESIIRESGRRPYTSILDLIAIKLIDISKEDEEETKPAKTMQVCPTCGDPLHIAGGCPLCHSCGYSKC